MALLKNQRKLLPLLKQMVVHMSLFSWFTLTNVICLQLVGFSNILARLTLRTNSFLQQDFSVLWECTRQDAKWVSLLLFCNVLQKKTYPFIYVGCFVIFFFVLNQEFEDSGDPEKHLQDLLTLAKEGKEKGKVCSIFLYIRLWIYWTYTFLVNALFKLATFEKL